MTEANESLEAEFLALAVAHNALAGVDAATRRRVLVRLCQRFAPDLQVAAAAQPPAAVPTGVARPRATSVTTVDFGPGGSVETTTWLPEG